MLFNSYIFIFLFLPICAAGFCLLKRYSATCAKVWLIGFSLWFYGYFNIGYLAIMVGSILFNYAVYRLIVYEGKRSATATSAASGSSKHPGRTPLIIGILGNVALLGYFKYTDFLIDGCNHIFRMDLPLKHILLPLGISFFTFQQIGFLADSYRDYDHVSGLRENGDTSDADAEYDRDVITYGFIDYALFVSFFPQLIAGPIADRDSMMPQYMSIGHKKRIDDEVGEDVEAAGLPVSTPAADTQRERAARGIALFILGLSKKVLIADTFGRAVDYSYGALGTGVNSAEAVLTILFYTLQLYFDFSGYCDMALGLGWMFGIDIPVNFDSPYKSRNIIEFWRRWHITLNKFLTKNIYIPLGGNRKGQVRTYVNLLIVFLISGIWHGAGVTFIIWGCMHGLMVVLTRMVMNLDRDRHAGTDISQDDGITPAAASEDKGRIGSGIISGVITFIFVCVAWVFFRAPDVASACDMLKSVFTGGFGRIGDGFLEGFNSGEFWYALKVLHLTNFSFSRYILMSLFALFGITVVFRAPNSIEMSRTMRYNIPRGILLGLLFVWCVLSLSGVSTFLYFNF